MQHVFEDGVFHWLSENRKNYMPELGGILLAWNVSKIKLKSPGHPPFKPEVNIKVSFVYCPFKPEVNIKVSIVYSPFKQEVNIKVSIVYSLFKPEVNIRFSIVYSPFKPEVYIKVSIVYTPFKTGIPSTPLIITEH